MNDEIIATTEEQIEVITTDIHLQQLIDNQLYQNEVFTIYFSLFLGILIGYIAIKGMLKPWR